MLFIVYQEPIERECGFAALDELLCLHIYSYCVLYLWAHSHIGSLTPCDQTLTQSRTLWREMLPSPSYTTLDKCLNRYVTGVLERMSPRRGRRRVHLGSQTTEPLTWIPVLFCHILALTMCLIESTRGGFGLESTSYPIKLRYLVLVLYSNS